jgi:hypothetical protein
VPARAANAASERRRPACDQLTSTWAALSGPTPGTSSSQGTTAWISTVSSAWSWSASAARNWTRWAVARSARTVAWCSSDLVGRSRRLAQALIWLLVLRPRSSARSSSGAPTISALSWSLTAILPDRLHHTHSFTRTMPWQVRRP